MKAIQASKIQIGTIHDVEGSRFGSNVVEDIHIVHLPLVMRINEGIGSLRSSSVCIFTAPL